MSRQDRSNPPPLPGRYTPAEIVSVVSDEEKAGQPVAPIVDLTAAGPAFGVSEGAGEPAGRRVTVELTVPAGMSDAAVSRFLASVRDLLAGPPPSLPLG